jgi:hypothetical protein
MLISDVQNAMVELANASQPSSGYGTIASERFKSGEFDFWIRAADVAVFAEILEAQQNGRRVGALTQSAIAHGGTIPTHVGPIDSVYFQVTGGQFAGTRGARMLPMAELARLENDNRNPDANPLVTPAAIVENNTVFHNAAALIAGGAAAASLFVKYATLTYSAAGTALQSPDEAIYAVAARALDMIIQKDGQRTGAGSSFYAISQRELASLGAAEQEQQNG